MRALRIGCMAATLLIPALKSGGANLPSQVEGHRSRLAARVVAADGTQRMLSLAGVGCTESMCSRVFLTSKDKNGAPVRTWLDSLASIKDATGTDALFIMKNGAERRLTFLADFRVLYVSNPDGRMEKLDLADIRSLEFLDAGR